MVEGAIADLVSGQWLTVQARSVASDLLDPEALFGLGAALSGYEALAVERFGAGDPPRHAVFNLPDQLAEWATGVTGTKVAELNVAREAQPHMNGRVLLHREPLGRGRRFTSIVELGYGADWFAEDDARLEPLVELMRDVVTATRACYASIEFGLLSWQRRKFWSRASRANGHAPSPYPGTPKLERHLDDVHWVQHFGPAFLDRWGARRFVELGVRREGAVGGGLTVWATQRPWHYNADAASIRDYEWKDPFYRALPDNAVWHEDFVDSAPGSLLPSLDEHQDRS